MSYLFQDYARNRGHVKIIFILFLFRLVNVFARRKGSLLWWLGIPLMMFYRVIVEYLLCVELRASTQVGPGLKIEHGYSLVINDRTIIGRNVHLRHCTTFGCVMLSDGAQGPSPVVGDNVEVGANSVIIGGIKIGNNAIIGAGSVVVKDVPANAVVVGNPARVIKVCDPSGQVIKVAKSWATSPDWIRLMLPYDLVIVNDFAHVNGGAAMVALNSAVALADRGI